MRGVTLLVAAILVAALAMPVQASASPVTPRSAAAFRDSVGIATHTNYWDTAYGEWPRLVAKLDDLGVDHLRDGIWANPSPEWRDWNERVYQLMELATSHGHKYTFIMGEPHYRAGNLDQLLGILRGRLRPAVDALEAPNEYDLFGGGPNWPAELRDYQRQLYAKAKADPLLKDFPVIGPSLVFGDSRQKLGSLEDALDGGNLHPYTGGEAPSQAHLANEFASAAYVSGKKPLYATEVGFHNALRATWGQPPVSEAVGASYLLRTYLEHFRAGVKRTFAYELIDEWPDPGLGDPERHFGLLRNDLSEKPAFTALRGMLRLIGRPDPVSTQPLDLNLSGDTAGVQQLLLQKSASRYTLVLWQAASEWDTKARRELQVSNRAVSLSLPAQADVAIGRPARSGDALTQAGRQSTVSLSVPADPLFVELDFGAAPPVEPPVTPPVEPPVTPPVKPPVKPPVANPSPCPTPRRPGALFQRRDGAQARIWSKRRPVRVGFCASRGGRATLELRLLGSDGRFKRVLATRQVLVERGQLRVVPLALSQGARRLRTAADLGLLVRVVYRAPGSGHAVVLKQRIPDALPASLSGQR